MSSDTTLRLAHDFNNIIAVKEASGDIVQAMKLIKDKPEDFLVISGDDMITLPMILAGGAGVISVLGQAFPQEFSKMIRLGLSGKAEEAHELHFKLMPITSLIFKENNPAGIKSVLNSMGLCLDVVRLPLVVASDVLKTEIKSFITNHRQ